jgi:hypothetical protein
MHSAGHHSSGRAVFDSFQRATAGCAYAGGAGCVCAGAGAVDCPQLLVSGTAVRHGGFCGLIEGTFVFSAFSTGTVIASRLDARALALAVYHKLFDKCRVIFKRPAETGRKLGGRAVFAGLFLGFRSMGARRMRYFLLMCLGTFHRRARRWGARNFRNESPEINSENLLVLLAPLVFIYGASFFFTFLDQMNLPLPQLRYASSRFLSYCAACR